MKLKNRNGGLKFPTLSGAANFYRITIEENKYHGSE
jgi:hypothetical protein